MRLPIPIKTATVLIQKRETISQQYPRKGLPKNPIDRGMGLVNSCFQLPFGRSAGISICETAVVGGANGRVVVGAISTRNQSSDRSNSKVKIPAL